MAETFAERLSRLVAEANMSEADVASVLGVTSTQARRVMDGSTQSLKLHAALRLCRRLGITPWTLAGERDPAEEVVPLHSHRPDRTTKPEFVERLERAEAAAAQIPDLMRVVALQGEQIAELLARLPRAEGVQPKTKARRG